MEGYNSQFVCVCVCVCVLQANQRCMRVHNIGGGGGGW